MKPTRLSYWLVVSLMFLNACGTSEAHKSQGCQVSEPETESYGTGSIEGTLLFDGNPVPFDTVMVERSVAYGDLCIGCWRPRTKVEEHFTISGTDGTFVFGDLVTGAGEWDLKIPYRRDRWASTRVVIVEGEVTHKDLVMRER